MTVTGWSESTLIEEIVLPEKIATGEMTNIFHEPLQMFLFTFSSGHLGHLGPFVLDGPINGAAFTAWVQQCLVPTLTAGDVVILDNLGSHKGKPARDAIRDVGAHLFFLPPHSPDLNPIEMMFAKLKLLVRKAEERTVETTWRRIGELLKLFSAQECANYPRHAGWPNGPSTSIAC